MCVSNLCVYEILRREYDLIALAIFIRHLCANVQFPYHSKNSKKIDAMQIFHRALADMGVSSPVDKFRYIRSDAIVQCTIPIRFPNCYATFQYTILLPRFVKRPSAQGCNSTFVYPSIRLSNFSYASFASARGRRCQTTKDGFAFPAMMRSRR